MPFLQCDLADTDSMASFFAKNTTLTRLFTLAGLKAVGESVADPLRYYDNNVGGSISLLKPP